MDKARLKRHGILLSVLFSLGVISSLLGMQGCQRQEIVKESLKTSETEAQSLNPTSDTTADQPERTPTVKTATSTPEDEYQPLWGDFPPPSIDPATPIPPPQTALDIPDEVLVWVLLGSDEEPPFIGRTPAIHLLFIHPRFSKASLISIPGDLYVYIPGYTMQRINTAYALGGIETLRQTFAYNFGVVPSRFVLAHPGDFQWLVDDINKIEVTVFYPMPQACGGIRAGLVEMDGTMALCYASYRDGIDEIDRMRRQQQLLRVIFRKLTRDGNLIQLPVLYASFEGWVKTDLSLSELMGFIPLALRLADADRIGYYIIDWDQMSIWEIPGYSQAQVFLPDQKDVKMLLEEALGHILEPAPLTDQVQTLEAQLTAAYQASETPVFDSTSTSTPTPSTTPSQSLTPSPTGVTASPSLTPSPTSGTASPSLTPSSTSGTASPSLTPSSTSGTSSPSPTATLTPPGYP
jgi:LCP family protein required for cell wall assembly